jgi:hypothetical protein
VYRPSGNLTVSVLMPSSVARQPSPSGHGQGRPARPSGTESWRPPARRPPTAPATARCRPAPRGITRPTADPAAGAAARVSAWVGSMKRDRSHSAGRPDCAFALKEQTKKVAPHALYLRPNNSNMDMKIYLLHALQNNDIILCGHMPPFNISLYRWGADALNQYNTPKP